MSKRLGVFICAIVLMGILSISAGGCKGGQQQAVVPPPNEQQVAQSTEQPPPQIKDVEKHLPGQNQQEPLGTVDQAKKMLQSESTSQQMEGVRALSEAIPLLPRDEALNAVQELIAIAKDPSRPKQIRLSAIGGLGIGAALYKPAEDALVEFSKSEDPEVRTAVVHAIEYLPNKPFAREIVERLAKDPDPGVSAEAIQVRSHILAQLKSRKALEELIKDLGNSVGDASAKAAIQLTIRGGNEFASGSKHPQVLPMLISALKKSKNPRQRHAITMCIALICAGTNPQQEKFGKLARTTKQTAVRLHPAVKEGLAPLIAALHDPDPYVREVAAQGLGYIGDEAAAPALAKALSDPNVRVRRRAASALITVPAKAAQPALEKAVRSDPDATVRRYAVEALGWIDDNSVVPALIAATRDSSARVRRYAALELGRRKAHEALDALIALFNDPDEDVRWQAVLAVGKLRDKRATDALIKALDDPAPQVANAAERALQKLGIARRKEKYLRS